MDDYDDATELSVYLMNFTRSVRCAEDILTMVTSIWKSALTLLFLVLWQLLDSGDISVMFDFEGRPSNTSCLNHTQLVSMDNNWVLVCSINLAATMSTYIFGRY